MELVAALLKYRGRFLFVEKRGLYTIPTGKFDDEKDKLVDGEVNFEKTIFREMKEEFKIKKKNIRIVETLGEITFGEYNFKVISCNVRKPSKIKSFTEGKFFVWMKKSNLMDNLFLDKLAKKALEMYFLKHPLKRTFFSQSE